MVNLTSFRSCQSFQTLREHLDKCHLCHYVCACENCVEQLVHYGNSINICTSGEELLQPVIKDYQFLSVCSKLDGM